MLSRGRRKGSIGAGQKQINPALVWEVANRSAEYVASCSTGYGNVCTIAVSTGLSNTTTSASSGLFELPISTESGFFGASSSVTAGSTSLCIKVRILQDYRGLNEFRRDGERYLVAVLERNPQLEFLVVPSHCLDCEVIVRVAGELLLSLKEFCSDAKLSQRPSTSFRLCEKRVGWSESQAVPDVKGCLRDTGGDLSHPLLSNYPRLRGLQMGISARFNHDALEQIRLADRRFTYLEIIQGLPSQVAQILAHAPPLKHLVLGGSYHYQVAYDNYNIAYANYDNTMKEAFLRHAPTLERLETPACDFSPDILQDLLCSAPSLRILKTIEGYIAKRPNKEVELDAMQVTRRPWICTQLETFECKILNVPRPDIVHTPIENFFPNPSVPPPPPTGSTPAQDHTLSASARLAAQQESHAIQRRVLRQLGQLTHLRTLSLGKYGCDFDHEEYFRLEIRDFRTVIVDRLLEHSCLELTLESGLDELRELQELEELHIYQMAHRIGLAEVKWMLEHWPKLRLVGGLKYRDCEREMNDALVEEEEQEHVKWIKQNRPDIQLI